MEFCKKLTQQERTAGRLPGDWNTRCRRRRSGNTRAAGTTGAYAGELDAMAWYADNSGNTTHPVGKKQPNAWGGVWTCMETCGNGAGLVCRQASRGRR